MANAGETTSNLIREIEVSCSVSTIPNREIETEEIDLLESLGMADLGTPFTPEETFYYDFTSDKHAKLSCLVHFIMQHLAMHKALIERNIRIVKTTMQGGVAGSQDIALQDFTKIIIQHYLMSNHFSRFHENFYVGATLKVKCDLLKTIDLLIEHEAIQAAIKGKFIL